MTEVIGQGLRLRVTLEKLHQRFRVTKDATIHKPSPPTSGPMVLSGICSNDQIDLDRMKFRKGALTWSVTPRLLYRHQDDHVAGRIDQLRYNTDGELKITATVDHEVARTMNAWSVGATVHEFEIINPNSPDFHALITKATLTEVSLVSSPGNQFALVTNRYPPSPHGTWAELMIRRIQVLQKMLTIMGSMKTTQPPPRSRTAFGEFVDQLQEQHHE